MSSVIVRLGFDLACRDSTRELDQPGNACNDVCRRRAPYAGYKRQWLNSEEDIVPRSGSFQFVLEELLGRLGEVLCQALRGVRCRFGWIQGGKVVRVLSVRSDGCATNKSVIPELDIVTALTGFRALLRAVHPRELFLHPRPNAIGDGGAGQEVDALAYENDEP